MNKWKIGKIYKTKGGWRAIPILIETTIIESVGYNDFNQKFYNDPFRDFPRVNRFRVFHEMNGQGGNGPLHPMAVSLGNFEAEHDCNGEIIRGKEGAKIIFDHPADLTDEELI